VGEEGKGSERSNRDWGNGARSWAGGDDGECSLSDRPAAIVFGGSASRCAITDFTGHGGTGHGGTGHGEAGLDGVRRTSRHGGRRRHRAGRRNRRSGRRRAGSGTERGRASPGGSARQRPHPFRRRGWRRDHERWSRPPVLRSQQRPGGRVPRVQPRPADPPDGGCRATRTPRRSSPHHRRLAPGPCSARPPTRPRSRVHESEFGCRGNRSHQEALQRSLRDPQAAAEAEHRQALLPAAAQVPAREFVGRPPRYAQDGGGFLDGQNVRKISERDTRRNLRVLSPGPRPAPASERQRPLISNYARVILNVKW
jgi:hypothetical protein